ncbi:hypothetical protein B6U99_00285 [Candidatus Geothermarchaeota archaeon ex4572_27]|nr:MAG: hypothetical protein B6U99_00285 [Candidatus Geothermarchaeota archaeon ex4572_27]
MAGSGPSYGDLVVLSDGRGRRWLITLVEGGELHTHYGVVRHSDIVGRGFGEAVTTHKGERLWLLPPTLEDLIMNVERRTQIVYPKDIGRMIVMSGICSGSRVLEVGTGSGALTTALAYVVRPDGVVDTYEKRREFYELARENLRRYGLERYVNFHNADFAEVEVRENYYDAAFVDIDSPWLVVEKVWRALKGGRMAFFVIPTYTQLDKIAPALGRYFTEVVGFEVSVREILMRPGKIRPPFQMIGYTAVIVAGRKRVPQAERANA